MRAILTKVWHFYQILKLLLLLIFKIFMNFKEMGVTPIVHQNWSSETEEKLVTDTKNKIRVELILSKTGIEAKRN